MEKKLLALKRFDTETAEILRKEWDYIRDLPADENGFSNGAAGISWEDFLMDYVPARKRFMDGTNLKEGLVRQIDFFLWDSEKIVGMFRVRPELDFTAEITRLALAMHAYDPQCEGTHTEYVMQFLRAMSEEKRQAVINTVKQKVQSVDITDEDWSASWSVTHLFYLAVKISHEFDSSVGDALRSRYESTDDQTAYSYFPDSCIVALDGTEGLVRVADQRGKMLSSHSDWWFDDLILVDVPGMEKEEARTILEKAVPSHPDIQIFLDQIDRLNAESEAERNERKKASAFELVKNAIEKSKRAVLRYAAKRLTQGELKYFAARFKKAKSQKECASFLSLFGYMPYPDDIGDLLKKMSVRINSTFNKWLVYVLSFFSAPELRALAEKALTDEKYAHFYLNLLAKNYRDGDGEKIVQRLSKIKNEDTFHSVQLDIEKIYEENTTADCLESLLFIYRTVRCGICRTRAAELMAKAGVLPDDIREELPFDAQTLEYAEE